MQQYNDQEQALLDSITKEFNIEPWECDEESAIDLAVDVGLLCISELQQQPDSCFHYIQQLLLTTKPTAQKGASK